MEHLIQKYDLTNVWSLLEESDNNTKEADFINLLSLLFQNINTLDYIALSEKLEVFIAKRGLKLELITELTNWYLNTPSATIALVWQDLISINHTTQ